MHILLVEDSATLRHAMCSYIDTAGHSHLVASSGEEAVQLIEHQPVDMVIMDVEMPGLDGYETTRLIREALDDDWIPIIFVTGKTDDRSVELGIEAGGDDYLFKPISRVILTAKIRAMERIITMRNQFQLMNTQLEHLSQRDSLTQLYNRRAFNELAERQWALSRRSHKPLSLIMLDVDHFKLYNDNYGHIKGDECLRQVAQALQKNLPRESDIIGRYGGEEFIILLPETPLDGAHQVAEALRKEVLVLEIPHLRSTTGHWLSASFGVACCEHADRFCLEDLVHQADSMLYRAKAEGRNQVVSDRRIAKTLLIINHEPHTLALLTSLLNHHCNIVTTESMDEFVELAQDLLPDLLILDADHPALDSVDVYLQLKQSRNTASIPIVLLQSEHTKQVNLVAKMADERLTKPLQQQQILDKIQPFLR